MSLLYVLIILILSLLYVNKKVIEAQSNTPLYLYLCHLFFTLFYFLYAMKNAADATVYYKEASHSLSNFHHFSTGTNFILFIITPLVKVLGMSLFNIYLLFGFFGYLGHYIFYKLLKLNYLEGRTILSQPLVVVVLYLPGFHFWTAALGKDSLIFVGIMLIYLFLSNIKKYFFQGIIGVVLVVCIRPHILMAMLIAVSVIQVLNFSDGISFQKIGVLALIIVSLMLALPFVQKFIHLDDLSFSEVGDTFDKYNKMGTKKKLVKTSNIDVTNYSLGAKMFTYMFRPIVFEARSVMQIISSIENIVILRVVYLWLRSFKWKLLWYKGTFYLKFLLGYSLISWIILAMGMYNLGIASRQKYMVLPALFLLCFYNQSQANKEVQ